MAGRLKVFLVDTNVWLERLLDQKNSEEVGEFLRAVPSERLFVTDFTFHSIAVVLSRLDKVEALVLFVRDAFLDGAVTLVHLEPEETERISRVMREFHLDFDDAYQYAAAEKHGLTIITFDADFDRAPRGSKTPGAAARSE